MTNTHLLEDVIRSIEGFRSADLLLSVAALQLLPENADRAVRLEALAHACASLPHDAKHRTVSTSKLQRLCDSMPIAITRMEDPCENPFTQAFTFIGGSFIVFPGISEEAAFILRHLCMALFLTEDGLPDRVFLQQARQMVTGILALSNQVAVRAGLDRGVAPSSLDGKDVAVPNFQGMERLRHALFFNSSDFAGLLSKHRVPLSIMDQFTVQHGTISVDGYGFDTGPLLARPLVAVEGGVVVSIPGMLLPALRHALLKLAHERGVAAELAKRYNSAVWHTTAEALGYLKQHPLQVPAAPTAMDLPCISEGVFGLDTDKLAYVVLITDPLDQYGDEVFGRWSLTDHHDAINARLKAVQEAWFTGSAPNEVLGIVIFQGLGRKGSVRLDGPSEHMPYALAMTAADLETIALLEGGEPLTLWNFCLDSWRLRRTTKVMRWSVLDEYQLYRAKDFSYYVTDDAQPNVMSIASGGGEELRSEVQRQRDYHAVPSHNKGFVVEVTALYDSREIPIYVPMNSLGQEVTVVVDGLPVVIWTTGPAKDEERDSNLHSVYAEFASMISYWLWQFTPPLTGCLRSLAAQHESIVIRLQLHPEWITRDVERGDRNSVEESIAVSVQRDRGEITCTILPDFSRALQGSSNDGERTLMSHILRGIRDLVDTVGVLEEAEISSILSTYAPSGLKKMMFVFDSDSDTILDPTGLPPYRKVQKAEEGRQLDGLGTYLRMKSKLPIGPVRKDDRTTVLNNAVGHLYRELVSGVASLKPDGLLEWLVGHHEAILQGTASHQLTIPTRLACFTNEPDMIKRLSKEFPDSNKVAIASRFLIEYVVAQPPQGLRPISISVYDHLLAVAALIFNIGMESDLLHFKLAEIEMSILPSGRLGADRAQWERTKHAYLGMYSAGEIARSTKTVRKLWTNREFKQQPDTDAVISRIDVAMEAEFNLSLTDLANFFGEMANMRSWTEEPVTRMEVSELRRTLSQSLLWHLDKVDRALNLFTLGRRPQFLNPAPFPSPPYRKDDILPWRFNRRLSYLRRPLLKRELAGGSELVWGKRSVYTSGAYLTKLCMDGRLQGDSDEMRKLMGEFNHENGEAFNDSVADLLESIRGMVVRRRVKKVGKLRGAEGPPGDLDVLAAWTPTRQLFAVECKDLAMAKTPAEMANEVTNLFQGEDGKPSFVERHLRRLAWVNEHVSEILNWLGIQDDPHEWSVEPLMIVDQELFTPLLTTSPVPVLSLNQLNKRFQ